MFFVSVMVLVGALALMFGDKVQSDWVYEPVGLNNTYTKVCKEHNITYHRLTQQCPMKSAMLIGMASQL